MAAYYESFSRDRDHDRDRDRDRDIVYSDDEDDRRVKTTVRRYKVGPERDHVERIDRAERTITRRDSSPPYAISGLARVEDRREYGLDRPRSAFDVSETSRRSERERDIYISGHGGRLVYEKTKETDRERPRDRDRDRDRDSYTRIQRRGDRDEQIVVESFGEDRVDDGHGGEVERWHRETEYYEPAAPPPQPIVIRNRPPDQNIIFHEAAAQPGVIVIRENDRHNDKSDRREDDRPRRHRHHHHHHRYASDGDYSDDGDYYVKKTTVIRRDTSPSTHRKYLAEGALAGAGLGALVGSRRNGHTGELPEHRGRKVLAGAALGALGTEVLKRAHSAYNERFGDEDDEFDRDRDRPRSRTRSAGRHSKLKTGLGIAAAALAVAGAAKYMQSGRIDREERNRGRSLRRYSDDESAGGYHSRSVSRPKSGRSHSVAKVAAGTAAVAGIVHHLRSKSRQREGKKARSHSRLRTGAEIAAAGLAGAAAKKIYDKRQDKKELARDRELNRELDDYSDDYDNVSDRGRHSARHSSRSLSPSRSRSRSAPPHSGSARAPYPPSTADADELGLVEYGSQPLYSDLNNSRDATYDHRSSYDSAANAVDQEDRHRRRRRQRSRHSEADRSFNDDDGNYADVSDSDRNSKRTRSRSRLRDLAAAGAGAAAAAIGLKKYEDKKKRDGTRKRDQETSRDDGSVYNDDIDHERHRSHGRHDRRDEADGYGGGYYDYDDSRPPSPPHASGGAYYPPAPPLGSSAGLMQHANANISEPYVSYNPLDHSGYLPPPGPPPGPPPPEQESAADLRYPGSAPPGPIPQDPLTRAAPDTGVGVVYPDAAGPLPSKTDPSYGAPPPPPPPAARDPTRSSDIPSPNLGVQPHAQAPHTDDHVSAALPLARNTAASAVTSLPPGSRLSKESVNVPAASDEAHDPSPKNVGFAPLSPQSSRTMLRHHVETGQAPAGALDKLADTLPVPLPSSDADHGDRGDHGDHGGSRALALSSRRRRSGRDGHDDRDEDGDGDVEDIPARFDSHGRPLSGQDASSSRAGRGPALFTTRHGDFEYNPERDDGWHVNGQWGVAGTDGVDVERIASGIRGAIDGIGSGSGRLPGIFGLIGGVLEGLSGLDSSSQIEDSEHDKTDRNERNSDQRTHHYPSSDDDRKRKRRNTYDLARSEGRRPRRRDRRQRSSSVGRITDGYFFDHDGYDGQEVRKRRRSWAS